MKSSVIYKFYQTSISPMKSVIIIFFIVSGLNLTSKACGWDPYYSYSYHLFNQHYIQSKGYDAFFKEELYSSWAYEHSEPVISKNIELWNNILPGWTAEEITQALTNDTIAVFEQLWSGKKEETNKEVYDYMVYARTCSEQHQNRKHRSWSYNDMVKNEVVDLSELIAQGVQAFNASSIPQLKLRYAYQVIRNYHYSKRYQEAIQFFNQFIKDQFDKTEIYYYVQDQVAGCYFSLKDYEKAAYMFLQVFSKSYDRKISSYTSYKFCTDKDAEGKQYFSDSEDQATYLTLKSIRGYSDQMQYLQEMAKVAPQDEKLELMFVRDLYDIEDRVFPRRIGMSSDRLLCGEEKNLCWDEIKVLSEISANQEKVCKPERKDFWILCSSYLGFLNGDFNTANLKLNEIQSYSKYALLGNQLKSLYKVFAWNSIGAEQEVELTKLMTSNDMTEDNKELIKEYVGHLLYHQGKLAQSFLVHNNILEIKNTGSLTLLQQLKEFILQPQKSSFEKYLFEQNIKEQAALMKPVEFIEYQIGMYYLNQADPQTALTHFNAGKDYSTGTEIERLIPAKVFSNNIVECFDCNDVLMEDSVYLASVFSFIKPRLTKNELAITLLKLDSLSHDEKTWKRKLANYLLGNYYFNVSNTGYYRGVLQDKPNCCNSYYFAWSEKQIAERNKKIEEQVGYNLCDVAYGKRTYYPLANKAYQYYRNTIALSTDKELNARCLYMMAKCELNSLYNHKEHFSYWGYDGNLKEDIIDYKKSFKELKDEYQDTRFFNRIIKECSFFRYYCSQ